MIEIKRIESNKELERFIEFRTALYKGDPYAVPYLHMNEVDTMNREKNPACQFCDVDYFLALRDGKPVGRIAAIINKQKNKELGENTIRFGYFDFIDDAEVVDALIDTIRQYGLERGMTKMIGPMGFTDMDREGMQVEGFDTLTSMHVSHNYPYYMKHMERLGFEKDNDWIQELINIPPQLPEKMKKVTEIIRQRYPLRARQLTKKQLLKEGYGQRLFEVLNRCYAHLYEYTPLTSAQVDQMLNDYLGLADMNLITFVFDESVDTGNPLDQLVGFGVCFPSFSEALRRTKNGHLFPLGWFHLLRLLLTHNTDTVDLMLIGVLPEYRSKGANALIFEALLAAFNRYGFKYALALPMMETNAHVLSAWQYFDSRVAKRLRSYKKML